MTKYIPCSRKAKMGCDGCPFFIFHACTGSGMLPSGADQPPAVSLTQKGLFDLLRLGVRLSRTPDGFLYSPTNTHQGILAEIGAGRLFQTRKRKWILPTENILSVLRPLAQAIRMTPNQNDRTEHFVNMAVDAGILPPLLINL